MEGLKVSNSETLLETGQTSGQMKTSQKTLQKGAELSGQDETAVQSFADTLNDAVNSVNQLQKQSDKKMRELATGESKNIADVMIASEKANISLKLMTQVRNKVITAYKQVMKMRI